MMASYIHPNNHNPQGFSLIELMAAFVVVSIVLVFGIPALSTYLEQTRADIRIMQLYNTLSFARHVALSTNQAVVICPTDNQHVCGGSWSGDLMVFTDSNSDQKIDGNDKLLRLVIPNSSGELRWQGFGPHNYILFVPYGFSNQQNGTFIYCSPTHQNRLTRGIIINKSGRARLAQVNNQGGIIDGNGQEIHC